MLRRISVEDVSFVCSVLMVQGYESSIWGWDRREKKVLMLRKMVLDEKLLQDQFG